MSEEPSTLQPNPVLRFFGVALLMIGWLIMGLCGLCTSTLGIFYVVWALAMMRPQLNSLAGWTQLSSVLGVVFVTGVLPTAIGVALMLVGWKLEKTHAPAKPGRSQDLKT